MVRFTIRDVLWLTVVVGMGAGWFVSSRQQIPEYERRLAWWEQSHRKLEGVNGNLSWEVHNLTQERDSWHKRSDMYESLYMEFQDAAFEATPQDHREKFESELRRLYEQKRNPPPPAPKPPRGDPFAEPS